MAERSFTQLPITSSQIGRRIQNNNRRGISPVSKYWIHAILLIVLLCSFTLWFFTRSVSLNMNDGEIISVHRLEKSIAIRDGSHVNFAILASSSDDVVSPIVSANQNLTNSPAKL